MTLLQNALIEKRPVTKWCFIEGDFVYESDQLIRAVEKILHDNNIQLFFAPALKSWLLQKGIIDDSKKDSGGRHLLVDEVKATALYIEICELGESSSN